MICLEFHCLDEERWNNKNFNLLSTENLHFGLAMFTLIDLWHEPACH